MNGKHDSADRWQQIIHRQQSSGLSVMGFCRQAGIAESTFYAWRKRLRAAGSFAEVQLTEAAGNTDENLKSAATSRISGSGIELRLPAGHCIVVHPGFDPTTLLQLLQVLESRVADLNIPPSLVRGGAVREKTA